MNLKILKCVYHRNGISGIGFYAVEFKYVEDGRERHAIGTVDSQDIEKTQNNTPPYNPDTRLLMLDEVGGVDIEETMRGDYFHADLVKWITAEQKRKYG